MLASTRAALDYLQKLYGMFGDWQLALAAYNWGEGSVQRAVARNQKAGLPTDYMSLRMPAETQDYVPKLQAVKNIIAHPANFGLQLPELFNHPYFLSVPIEHDIDVASPSSSPACRCDEFQILNPQMNRPVILAAGTPQILLPYDNANRFVRELPLLPRRARQLDGLGRAEDDEAGGSGARGRHGRGRAARRQPDPGAHADPLRLDPARAARQRHDRRRLEHGRRQRHDHARARRAAAAQALAARRPARHRRLGGAPLSGQPGAGRAVERHRHGREIRARTDRGRLCRRQEPHGERRRAYLRPGALTTRGWQRPARRKSVRPARAGTSHKHVVARN